MLHTKTEILVLLTGSHKTLTTLSAETGLVPSTISQHLKELLMMGAIRTVENTHIKKWKYYERVEGFEPEMIKSRYGVETKKKLGRLLIPKPTNFAWTPQRSRVFMYTVSGVRN